MKNDTLGYMSNIIFRLWAYYGGKYRMAREIISLFPEHDSWYELFAGGLSVTMTKKVETKEWVNDLDPSIYHFIKTLKDSILGKELIDRLEQAEYSEELFDNALKSKYYYHKGLSDVEKALMIFVEITQSFSCLRKSFSRGGSTQEAYSRKIMNNIPHCHERLQNVKITNLDALVILEEIMNDEGALVYLDCPYLHDMRGKNAHNAYGCEMSFTDQLKMLKILQKCKCKVILSGYRNDVDEDLYDKFLMPYGFKAYLLKTVTKSAMYGKKGRAEEVVWVNYPLPEGAIYNKELTTKYGYIKYDAPASSPRNCA